MRAAVLQDGQLAVQEIPEPVPGPGEVLVEVLATGICGSDKSCVAHPQKFNHASIRAFGVEMLDLSRPIVLGHEFVGRIVEHGPDTEQRLPVGTRVVSIPALLREDPVLLGFAGPETPGGFAERVLLTEAALVPVPDEVPTDVAALTEPLAVALHALGRADVGQDDVPLVLGCGPIGLATIVMLKGHGIGPIVATDLVAERRDLAAKLGADVVVDPAESSPYEAWMGAAATDDPDRMATPTFVAGQLPLRPTVGFECTGAPGVLQQMIEGAPPGSRVAVEGINLDTDEIVPSVAIIKELDVRHCLYYTPEEYGRTLQMLADGTIEAADLITDVVGLEEADDALARLGISPTDAKILVHPND